MTEEKLNINITKIDTTSSVASDLSTAVLSDDDAYDAVVGIVSQFSSSISSGYLLELGEMEYLDTTKPWWKGEVIDDSSIAGKRFMLFGDILWNDKNVTWALCFNKNLAEENQIEDPYALVREGKWTLDKFEEQCKDISKDLDGNTIMDNKDQWGLLASNNVGIGLVTSCGVLTTQSDSNGMTFSLGSSRNIDALGAIYEFLSDREMTLRAEEIRGVPDVWKEATNVFREGRALYRIVIMRNLAELRDMDDDFGIIPMPKLDENQDRYYTTYQGWTARCYAVPITVSDPERTGIILEYMASVSTDTVLSAYYDTTLQRKVARDNESAEMLDIIFNSVTTDIALAMELGGIRTSLSSMINAESNTIASSIASIKTSMQTQLDTIYESVSELE